MTQDPVVDRVRALCLSLPEATERTSHGEPAWFVRKAPQFATFADHHHDDRTQPTGRRSPRSSKRLTERWRQDGS